MGELRDAFDRSVAAGSLTKADQAAVAAGRKLADRIDEAEGADATKAMYLVPHLVSVLRELHLTPAARERLPKADVPAANPIDELLAKRKTRARKPA